MSKRKRKRVGDLEPGDRVIIRRGAAPGQEETLTVRSVKPSKSGATMRVEYSGGYHPKAPRQGGVNRIVEVLVDA